MESWRGGNLNCRLMQLTFLTSIFPTLPPSAMKKLQIDFFASHSPLISFVSSLCGVIKFNQLSLLPFLLRISARVPSSSVFVYRQQKKLNLVMLRVFVVGQRASTTESEQFNHVIIVTLKKYKITISLKKRIIITSLCVSGVKIA